MIGLCYLHMRPLLVLVKINPIGHMAYVLVAVKCVKECVSRLFAFSLFKNANEKHGKS